MNILFFYTNEIVPEHGGVQRITKVLADHFLPWAKVFFLALNCRANIQKDNYFYLPDKHMLDSGKNKEYFKKLLDTLSIDLVINQAAIWEKEGYFCCQLTKDKGIRLFSVIHSDPFLYRKIKQKLELEPKPDFKNIIKRKIFPLYACWRNVKARHFYTYLSRHSEKVIFLSASYKQKVSALIGNKGTCGDNLISIPNFIEMNPDLKIDIRNKQKSLLYVGRINFREKRVDDLIMIWSVLWQKFPDWQFVLLGDGEHLEEARKMVKDLEIKNICFKGYCSPEEYYERSSIICLSSLFEGFGMVLVEGQKRGCVPIAYDSFTAVFDIIREGVNGRLVTAFKREEFIKKLGDLMSDKEERMRMAEQAMESVKRFSADVVVKSWKEIILN